MAVVEQLFQKITNEIPRSVRQLTEGFNNASYLINGDKVFRLKKMSDTPFYSTANEGNILKLIAPNRIGPRLFYFDYSTGNMIDRFIEGDHRFLSPDVKEEELKSLASVLKRLHSIKGCVSEFYPKQRFDSYKQRSGNDLKDPNEEKMCELFYSFYSSDPLVLCHNDLVKDNVIIEPVTNKITLIDFEFAGLNVPEFDLASVIGENEIFDPAKVDYFLSCYYGSAFDKKKRNRVAISVAYSNYLWYYWAVCRYKETNYGPFSEIAEMKLKDIELQKQYANEHPDFYLL
ncbi:MAG: phosphotransferase [Bacilli bacterium]|jgi:thiamine kinase-like enzyme|nr:phosphotransferase [Bacilli bacterium]